MKNNLEKGQTTVEYVLILVMIATVIIGTMKRILIPYLTATCAENRESFNCRVTSLVLEQGTEDSGERFRTFRIRHN